MQLQTKGNKERSRYKYIDLAMSVAWGWRMYKIGEAGTGHFQIRGKDKDENSYNLELTVEEAESIAKDIDKFLADNRERHTTRIQGKP